MFLHSFRRPARRWTRPLLFFLAALCAVDFLLNVVRDAPVTRIDPATPQLPQRIFIASMHWNNEAIIRSHWSAAVLDLVKHYGPENVYVSIVESGSWDNTKGALKELDVNLGELGVERSIKMYDKTHLDEINRTPDENEPGWIWTSREKKELRRIPYLAKIRNQVMQKLKDLEEGLGGRKARKFDKILWLNDVVFTVSFILYDKAGARVHLY